MEKEITKKMGRHALPTDEKKGRIIAFVPKKMINLLGESSCKNIAEKAIATEYETKQTKKK